MATTTNFGWETPDDTDLVKDGAAAMRTLGNSIDASFVDLKGGTTGQILSKNSNTDLDYVWINNDQGDITGVTATAPLTGGGTSGAITVGIQDGTTTQKGAVQLENSTSSTSTTTAAVPASVKSAYDLANTANSAASSAQTTANAAIPKSTVTTNGDLIYGTGSATVTRLGIGSTGQVLTVSGGVPAWSSPSSSTLPAFRAYGQNQQSFSANTWTKVTYDVEVFDTDNKYASNRFTPGVAGYYYVSARMQAASGSNNSCFVSIYKNGVANTQDSTESNPYASGNPNAVIYLSATDYVEVYALINFSGGNSNGDNILYFSAVGIRS